MVDQLRPDARRTYGAGVELRRTYAFGLPKRVFYALFVSLMAAALLAMIGFTAIGIGWAVVSLVAVAPLAMRIGGKTGYDLLLLEWAWRRQRSSGRHILRAGPLSQAPSGRTRLPGVAASTEMWWGTTKHGHRFGMIRNPFTKQYTAVLRCSPRGINGMEQDVINAMVAEWGGFLAEAAQPGDIVGVVTVAETIPETGARLKSEMSRIEEPTAPSAAREWLHQAGAGRAADRSGYQLHMRMAITWAARTEAKRRDPMVMVADLAERLPQMCAALGRVQVVAEPMSDYQIAATVRRAYDPRTETETAVEDLMRMRGSPAPGDVVDWLDAGPVAADELDRETLAHDGAFSRTWVMTAPPAGFHDERILRALIVGRSDIPRKRITLIHRPLPPGEATESVDGDYLAAAAEVTASRGISSARAKVRLAATMQARDEEARGSGVTDYAMVITVTAHTLEELDSYGEVAREMKSSARLKIRPAWNQQAAAFLTGLGIGVLLPDHATVSRTLQGEA